MIKFTLPSRSRGSRKNRKIQQNKHNYRKFNWIILIISLLPVLLIGLFNIVVDPYGVIGSPVFGGFNRFKPEQDTHNSLVKTIDVIRLKPKTVLLGSSRVIIGLDPSHPGLIDRQNAYNLGIPAIHLPELNYYVQHVLINQSQAKQIVIGLDFFMFGEFDKDPRKLNDNLGANRISLNMLMNIVMSWQTFEDSQSTVIANLNRKSIKNYYFRGMRINSDSNNKINGRLIPTMSDRFKQDMSSYLEWYYNNYKLSNNNLKIYKEIVDICHRKNIDIKVFISPESASQLEAIRLAGLWSVFEQWKRELSQITPLWDFSTYNSITIEPISDDMQYFLDGTHYSKQVGDFVLNRVLSYQEKSVPGDFGILIAPKNIESHLAKIRADRELWAKKDPDTLKLVRDIKEQFDLKNKSPNKK